MTIRCLVVDDEPLGRKIVEEHLEQLTDLVLVASVSSALEAQQVIDQQSVDVIFLDINMPKLSGLDWMKTLENEALIVFTTAYSEYAVDAFDVKAFDFLVKPISFSRFMNSINRVRKHLTAANHDQLDRHVLIREGRRLYKVDANDIIYLQAFGDYLRIFSTDKKYITKDRMHLFMKQLPTSFTQVHRSYTVNMKHIQYLEGNQIVLTNATVPISAKYRQEVLDKL